jgi:hypothetical protein
MPRRIVGISDGLGIYLLPYGTVFMCFVDQTESTKYGQSD